MFCSLCVLSQVVFFLFALKERMASKIDSAEGSVMAELEGMESKRLEAATDYAGKLEDR